MYPVICDMIRLNLLLYSILPGPMERKLVWESCFNCGAWGLLEMHILLTDDIVEFGLVGDVDKSREVLMTPAMYIQLPYINHEDLLLSFLMVRCPVSNHDNFFL